MKSFHGKRNTMDNQVYRRGSEGQPKWWTQKARAVCAGTVVVVSRRAPGVSASEAVSPGTEKSEGQLSPGPVCHQLSFPWVMQNTKLEISSKRSCRIQIVNKKIQILV